MIWLDEIEERAKAATPGPWKSTHKTDFGGKCGHADISGPAKSRYRGVIRVGELTATNDDADFIANAREDIPRLVTVLRSVMAKLQTIVNLENMQGCEICTRILGEIEQIRNHIGTNVNLQK